MGQKNNANALRFGIIKKHHDCFYAERKKYADCIHSHIKVRHFLTKRLASAGVSKILIERPGKSAQITIFAARPGMIIGKKGSDVESLRKEVSQFMSVPIHLVIKEVRKPDLDAELVAQNIAIQLQKRVMLRRVMRRAVQVVLKAGAQGVRVCISGRLGGAEIASTKWYHEGRLPLHTFRANIDYAFAKAKTTYGLLGVKVWIFKGEVVKKGTDHVNTETDKV